LNIGNKFVVIFYLVGKVLKLLLFLTDYAICNGFGLVYLFSCCANLAISIDGSLYGIYLTEYFFVLLCLLTEFT
jgi:hypothetical protein